MTLNCAIVGCGLIAGGYDTPLEDNYIRTHAKAIKNNSRTRLIAVCDKDIDTAKKFAEKWEVENFYDSLDKLVFKHDLGLLCISTPTNTHLPLTTKALELKIPCIWLEKPAAHNLTDLKEMMILSKKSSSKIFINYFRRYDEGFKKIKNYLDSSEVLSVTAYYTKGLSHNGSHLLNLLNWWFGELKEFNNLEVFQCEKYPSVTASLNYEKAKVDIKAFDHNLFELFELDIILRNSRIRVLEGGQRIEFYKVNTSPYYKEYRNLTLFEVHEGTYGLFMKEGLNSILNGEVINTLEEELIIRTSIEEIEREAGISRDR